MSEQPQPQMFRRYILEQTRKRPSQRVPEVHQRNALNKLKQWYTPRPTPRAGGILVLPTGGGKTFTAVRFLCEGPLSEGYRVLWLAHTHHLLEQALDSFGDPERDAAAKHGHETGHIRASRSELQVRVVSGTEGHFPVTHISTNDDIIIGTIQTITRAYWNEQPQFTAWLAESGHKLVIVFDEAHHAPAPSYRKLLNAIQDKYPQTLLLGLTATPTYTDQTKQGWLTKLFPQGIISQVTASELMSLNILAKPIVETHHTDFTPTVSETDYAKWRHSYSDIPETIISQLAESRERNSYIAQMYADNRATYGKTIIFADRWYQCEQIAEFLRARGVKAGSIYSRVNLDQRGPAIRNTVTRDDNATTLEAFRNGDLEVLLNVRMLTEGTDVPKVQSVFLTRQTTSPILMTQMIGRALRGPKFGGTAEAYIVAFIDNWQHLINWADYELRDGQALESTTAAYVPRPLQLISIQLLQRLIQMMGSVNVELLPYRSLLPVGWYKILFTANVAGTDNTEPIHELIMVYDTEQDGYTEYLNYLASVDLDDWNEHTTQEEKADWLAAMEAQFFGEEIQSIGTQRLKNLFHLARHIRHHEGNLPTFHPFEARDRHNLDNLAEQIVNDGLDSNREVQLLKREYDRTDCYWKVFYPGPGDEGFWSFKAHSDACKNRLLRGAQSASIITPQAAGAGETYYPTELDAQTKAQVKRRDGNMCLCCGSERNLQIDHIIPVYKGGTNDLDNLQTLCKTCNTHKGISEMRFRHQRTSLITPPTAFPALKMPSDPGNVDEWKIYLRRLINAFYQCAAVDEITIKTRGDYFWNWTVTLRHGNNPAWLQPFLGDLAKQIYQKRSEWNLQGPNTIRVQ
ncbi:MAG: DEAD/DEAH box helicase family protein [Chloroflexaceae bacterium]|nr:DEAD/DEAH box helicase family protein [Chloroflexaceae bacterium]